MNTKKESTNQFYLKMRVFYLIATAITIPLGLASRKYSDWLLAFFAQNAGDMLWAMMVYFGFRFLFVRMRLSAAIWLSFLFSFGIEFSQLYQENWINQIRHTLLGSLILGQGFLLIDLVRYATGIAIASLLAYRLLFKLNDTYLF
ncbi:DUF2809 domain-containing protein [Bacillus sp. NEB1478]|uniref:ribosomal maturation YjgA family protein n=1 Tax=Bacillus sp. NEB1478 TaxID=3073816 RepID=UPI002873C2F4|nr:DUF2809 domain-containing protein [Bacillus sp. NEB1478]WNB91043.1 DUF2809 domain-containing protein [Bacillus sp. NEB1478]